MSDAEVEIDIDTIVEISVHSDDLQISLIQRESDGAYTFVVVRGPGACFKMLWHLPCYEATLAEVVITVKNLLEMIQLQAPVLFGGLDARFSVRDQYGNEGFYTCRDLRIMHADFIPHVIAELREQHIAATFNIPHTKSG